jgi:hypothetical protein
LSGGLGGQGADIGVWPLKDVFHMGKSLILHTHLGPCLFN